MPLFIHIGYHKTGTTAIQEFLEINRDNLKNIGWLFPQGLSNSLGHPELSWIFAHEHYPWQDQLYDRNCVLDYYRPFLEASRDPKTNVLISSEEFCRLDFAPLSMLALKKSLSPYNPIIFGYTRDAFNFLLSRYRHEVQHGAERRRLRDFVLDYENLKSAAFDDRTAVWEVFFPKSCLFQDYEGSFAAHGSIVDSFLKHLDIRGEFEKSVQKQEKKMHTQLLGAVIAILENEKLNEIERVTLFEELFAISDKIGNDNSQILSVPNDLRFLLSTMKHVEYDAVRTVQDVLTQRDRERAERYYLNQVPKSSPMPHSETASVFAKETQTDNKSDGHSVLDNPNTQAD